MPQRPLVMTLGFMEKIGKFTPKFFARSNKMKENTEKAESVAASTAATDGEISDVESIQVEPVEAEAKDETKGEGVRDEPRGVVKCKNLNRYLEEDDIFKFFSQFGQVTRFSLKRSRKSGKSRRLAYIEFKYSEVADIVAQAMDGFIDDEGSRLVCTSIDRSEIPYRCFFNWRSKDKHTIVTTRKLERKKHEVKPGEKVVTEKKLENVKKSLSRKKKALEKLGISYNYDLTSKKEKVLKKKSKKSKVE
eukprot:GHVP01068841.1.p2 GENE.GHVP01068841.1~~GHVP01068841.1.p2  ORF type:complete len:248 (+),score=50.69 GHVP01068841.1:1729-2472(+)